MSDSGMGEMGVIGMSEKRVQRRENWRQRMERLEAEQTESDILTHRGVKEGKISEKEFIAREAEIRSLGYKDERTGLGNLRAFRDHFDRMKHDGLRIGMIIFDIDHFKQVNDEHGHSVGDMVLEAVGRTAREMPLGGDVFRVGGEEFVFLFDAEDAEDLQEMTALAGDVFINGWGRDEKLKEKNVGRITVSMGAAILGQDEDLGQFFDKVDRLLYKAKRADPETGAPGRRRAMVEVGPDQVKEVSFGK